MKQVLGLADFGFIEHGFCDADESRCMQDVVLMNQVHSADVSVIDKKPEFALEVDALITQTPCLKLTVKTADCAPILIVDVQTKTVAAIHAGWKGALQGIIEITVLKMMMLGGHPDYMVVGIGPHIQKHSFEADEAMRSLFPVTEHHFFTKKDNGRFEFDFHAYIVHRLKRAGITHIDSVLIDTFTDNDYNSYRRDPKNPDRQYSYIQIK